MKILMINVRLDSGSVGRIVRDLYKGIKSNGHECRIAYARGNVADIPEEDTIKICSENEVIKHAVLTRLFGRTAFHSHRSTIKFLEWVDKYNPDIIHIHGVYGYYINMKDLFEYISRKNIKLVSTLHSCWDFTGHCCHFDYIGCEKWKQNCTSCPQKSAYPQSSFLDNTEWNFNQKKALYHGIKNCVIVTPSKWLERLANKSFLNVHRIMTIENGVDIDVFRVMRVDEYKDVEFYGIDIEKPVILCVANIWQEKKGLSDVRECMDKLQGTGIQMVVVGLTSNQIKEIYSGNNKSKKNSKEYSFSNIICLERTRDVYELAKLYNSATVLFNPTYEDNYPTVNVEAIACGTPVVTYNTGGSPEAIRKYNSGQIIEKKDYDKLIDIVRKYYQSDRTVRFDEARKYDISFERMTREYLDIYNEMNNNL